MKTVLLVEPERETADIIAQYVHKHRPDLAVAHASDAQSAVHMIDENTPNVVVVELAIPGHNGLAFLHEFRSYSDWIELPVIVHSHLPPESTLSSAEIERLGIKKYLYKPTTSLAKLLTAIDECL